MNSYLFPQIVIKLLNTMGFPDISGAGFNQISLLLPFASSFCCFPQPSHLSQISYRDGDPETKTVSLTCLYLVSSDLASLKLFLLHTKNHTGSGLHCRDIMKMKTLLSFTAVLEQTHIYADIRCQFFSFNLLHFWFKSLGIQWK